MSPSQLSITQCHQSTDYMQTIPSTMTSMSMKDKRRAVQMSIYMQTGQPLPNLRRHESAPETDIDQILNEVTTKTSQDGILSFGL